MVSTKLVHGDCLEKMRDIPDGSVDMVFADLPYGVMRTGWDQTIPLKPLWTHLLRVGKKNCAFVFTATQPFATSLVCSQPKLLKYELIWDKGTPANIGHAKYRVMRFHENIFVFSQSSATYGAKINMTYNPQMTPRERPRTTQQIVVKSATAPIYKLKEEYGGKLLTHYYPSSILRISPRADKSRGLHPTQKPVALLEWLIKTYSNPGDVILDPTAGSGTTGVACINTGRHFIGMEKDPAYFEVARKRIDAASAVTCIQK